MNINENVLSQQQQLNGVGSLLTASNKSRQIINNNTQTYKNDDLDDEDHEGDELLKNEINNNNNIKSKSTLNKSLTNNNIDLDTNNNNIKSNRSSSMKQRVRTTSGNTNNNNNNSKNVDILNPSLSLANKITSPIKQNKNNVSRSSSKINNNNHDNNNKHEITFMFKKNRSISHSHTTKYDLYGDDENNDEKQIVDVEDEDEENEDEYRNRNVSKSNHHISSPKLRQKSIMNDIVDSITCEGAVAGAIIAGVPMHGANITNIPTSMANNNNQNNNSNSSTNATSKTGSSTLSSSSSHTNESSSLSSKSDNACSSSTSDLSTINPKLVNDLNNLDKETNFIESHHNLNSNNLNKSKIYTKHNQYIKQTGHDDLKVIILDDKSKNEKRDSIRMRHYSSTGQQNNSINKIALDGIEEIGGGSKSRLFRRWKRTSPIERQKHKSHNYIVIFLLFVVNLLNYIDRYTLAG